MASMNFHRAKPVTLKIYSWNVNAKIEEMGNLSSWLNIEDEPDIISVGFQEIIELSATNIVGSALANKSCENSFQWLDLIRSFLNGPSLDVEKYCLLESVQLVGLCLFVFAHKKNCRNISNIQSCVIPRGISGILGNKGAVCIRLRIFDTSVCFVSSHFTAHLEQVQKRNDDFVSILYKDAFSDKALGLSQRSLIAAHAKIQDDLIGLSNLLSTTRVTSDEQDRDIAPEASVQPPLPSNAIESVSSNFSINDHDVIFWSGDLNYRIEQGPSLCELYDLIKANSLSYLHLLDQLNMERSACRYCMACRT